MAMVLYCFALPYWKNVGGERIFAKKEVNEGKLVIVSYFSISPYLSAHG
jgi:hypothetical protein